MHREHAFPFHKGPEVVVQSTLSIRHSYTNEVRYFRRTKTLSFGELESEIEKPWISREVGVLVWMRTSEKLTSRHARNGAEQRYFSREPASGASYYWIRGRVNAQRSNKVN